jgi:hypothetical protein
MVEVSGHAGQCPVARWMEKGKRRSAKGGRRMKRRKVQKARKKGRTHRGGGSMFREEKITDQSLNPKPKK